MAISNVTDIRSALASAAQTTKQFYGARLNSSGQIALATIAGQRITGVLQGAAASGALAEYAVAGETKVKLSGTVSEDDRLAVTTSGDFVKAVGGDFCFLRASQDGVTGDIIAAYITNEGYVPAWDIYHECDLAGITGNTVDALTAFVPGYAKWRVERFAAHVNVAATTGSKDASFQLKKNSTVLLGTLSLTSANCTPKGVVAASTAITETTAGDADGVVASTITIDAVTVSAAFAEGTVVFRIGGSLGDA